MAESIALGRRRELLLDGHVIEWRDGLERRVQPVAKHPDGPVIRPEEDWEPEGYITFGSVLHDEQEGLYKAWCYGTGKPWALREGESPVDGAVHYFTSADGLRWERPELDLVEVAGRRTNIVMLTDRSSHPAHCPGLYEPFGVSHDPDASDPARRYLMGYLHLVRDYHGPGEDPLHPGSQRGLGAAFSPDGVHWTPVGGPVTAATCDGTTYWMRDPATGRYVLYGRTRHVDPAVRRLHGERRSFQQTHWGRAVRRAESEEFVHWEPDQGELILAVDVLDGPGDEIYGLQVFPYEGIYVGLLQVFHNYPQRVWLDIQLAVSRDGVRFDRLSDRTAFIPVGGVGDWDRFNNSPANNPPLRVGEELWFYYGGRSYVHSGRYEGRDNGRDAGLRFHSGVGLGRAGLDRFAAMEAGFEGGTLLTRPMVLEGERLHLNADVACGVLDVAVLDEAAHPIEGMEARLVHRDGVDLTAPIAGLAGLRGRPVRLSLAVRNGRLYSFWAG